MKIDVVKPWENFRGMSYGNWAAAFTNWLFSADIDNYDGGDMLFLRGNVDYLAAGGDDDAPRRSDPDRVFSRIERNAIVIFEDTAIFVPVIASYYVIGDLHEGFVIQTEEQLRYYIYKDNSESGPLWANIMRRGDKTPKKLVSDLREYRIESPAFSLRVPKNSVMNEKVEQPLKHGINQCIAGGYFVIIRSLPTGYYRIAFGAQGRQDYHTKSAYDIIVKGKRVDRLKDTSTPLITAKYFKDLK